MTRRARVVVGGLALVPLAALAVLGGEVEWVRIAPRPGYGPVLDLDSPEGGGGPRVVWLGDSTAAGVGVSRPSDALPNQAASASGVPQQVVSLAVAGARVADVLDHQVASVPATAAVVVIDVGANDVVHLGRTAAFRRQYAAVLHRLPRGARVVMLGVPDMGSVPRFPPPLRAVAGWRGRAFDAVVRSLARSFHARYVDIAGATGPAFRHHPGEYFFGDGYHPDAAGYRLWADAVAPVLTAALGGGRG